MRRFSLVLFVITILSGPGALAARVPVQDPVPVKKHSNIPNFHVTQIEKLLGKKLSFFQKTQLKILRKKLQKSSGIQDPTDKQIKQGRLSALMGGTGLAFLVIGVLTGLGLLALLAILLAIFAIILGARSRKGNKNHAGLFGIITGSITLGLLLLSALLILAFSGVFF
jgi:hypothetical protein